MQILMYLKNFDQAFNAEHVMWFCVQTRRTLVERCVLRIESFTFVDDWAPDTLRELPYRLFSNLWLEDQGFSRCATGTPWRLFVLLGRNKSWQNPRFVALSHLQSQTSSFPLILLMPN
jgi:hypothetical protein